MGKYLGVVVVAVELVDVGGDVILFGNFCVVLGLYVVVVVVVVEEGIFVLVVLPNIFVVVALEGIVVVCILEE